MYRRVFPSRIRRAASTRPDDTWIHADDGFDRSERPFERHYFEGGGEVSVPLGLITIEVSHGYGYQPQR